MTTIEIFNPRTGESARVTVGTTKAGRPNKTDLRRLVGRWKIPLRFVACGMHKVNPVPDGGWPPEYVWEGAPPDLTPLLSVIPTLRESMLARGFKDEW